MFTDGVGSDMSYFEEDADGNGIPDYAELAEKKGVQIVTLAFGDRNLGKITTAQKSLKSISKMTGGQYYYCSIVPNGDEFPVEEVPELSDKAEDIKKSTKKAASNKTPDGKVGSCGFTDAQLKQMFDKDADNPAKLGDGTLVRSIMKDDNGKTVTKSMFKNGGKDYDKDGLNNNKELVLTDVYDSNSKPFYRKQGWVMLSNPVKKDTDGDGINDKEDTTPNIYTIIGKDKMIDKQYGDYQIDINGKKTSMKDIPFGTWGNIADKGCGVIAAYNLMLLKNPDIQFIDVKNDIEKMGGAVAGGLLGTDLFALKDYLDKNFEKVFMKSVLSSEPMNNYVNWSVFSEADAVIIWVQNNINNIWDGYHYIAGINLHDNKNGFDFYNTYPNYKGISLLNFLLKMQDNGVKCVSICAVYNGK